MHSLLTPPTWGNTGTRYATAQLSGQRDSGSTVNTAPVRVVPALQRRVAAHPDPDPLNYACTPGLNPETTAGSCWWGIEYSFSAQPYDVTTWKARIEGNSRPPHGVGPAEQPAAIEPGCWDGR